MQELQQLSLQNQANQQQQQQIPQQHLQQQQSQQLPQQPQLPQQQQLQQLQQSLPQQQLPQQQQQLTQQQHQLQHQTSQQSPQILLQQPSPQSQQQLQQSPQQLQQSPQQLQQPILIQQTIGNVQQQQIVIQQPSQIGNGQPPALIRQQSSASSLGDEPMEQQWSTTSSANYQFVITGLQNTSVTSTPSQMDTVDTIVQTLCGLSSWNTIKTDIPPDIQQKLVTSPTEMLSQSQMNSPITVQQVIQAIQLKAQGQNQPIAIKSEDKKPIKCMESVATGSGKVKGPTCKVCGDEASGFHYGVDSCEGCKGFFRRCITQGMNHRCSNDEKCEITPFSRNSCQYCRLKKCFAVGMSREASRLGRRPKRLKEAQDQQGPPRSYQSTPPIAPYPSLSPKQLSRLSMAELQRLLQALNGQKTNILPPNFLKFEPQESNVSSNDSESGYSTFGGDTPTSNKSRSPDTSQLVNGTAVSNGQQHQAGPEGVTIKLEPGVHGGHFRVPHTQNVPSNGAMNVMNGVSNNGHQQQQGPPSVGQQVSNNGQLDTQQSQQQSELDCNAHIAQFMRGQMGGPSPPAPPSGGANNIMSTEDFIAQKKAAIKQEAASPTSCGGGGANATKSPPVSSTIVTSIYECDRSLGVVQQLLADSKQVPSGSKAILVQQVIQTVVEAHLETCNYTEEKVKAGMEKFRVKLESGNMPWAGQRLDAPQFSMGSDSPQDRMSGMQSWMTQAGMPDMSMMDPSKSWSQFVENMVPVITRVVRFSKKLPGFLELDQEDQIKLIKQGSFEVMVARYLPLFQDDGLFVPTMEFKIPREVIMAMPMGAFFEQQFEFARQFRPLNLNDQEMGLLTAVMIMNADRQGLTNRKSVYKLQGLFLQAFYTYIRQNHPENFDDFFMNAINSLPLLRHINETHSRHLNMMKMSSDFKLPKLHEEVFEG